MPEAKNPKSKKAPTKKGRKKKAKVTADQLVLELLEIFAEETPVVTPSGQMEDAAKAELDRLFREAWNKIAEAYDSDISPQKFSEEAFRLTAEFVANFGKYEWSCKVPNAEEPQSEVNSTLSTIQ